MSDAELRYPIGKFQGSAKLTDDERKKLIAQVEETPNKLRAAVKGLSREQLMTPYRDGGWTVQQVVHHLADSHINAYTRFKLALTEDEPTIKPYNETRWAELSDSKTTPVETSLALMDGLHERWINLMHGMSAAEFGRKMKHPERGTMTLDETLGLYAWHGRHHVAHITGLRERKGWK
ncbi:MAG TPA: bacillithiol transferase BstA [Candidatus Acidoferrales bacterium]|nr:bacillithiol transferase BstA [Candidatus Acidoferrales bacterium]